MCYVSGYFVFSLAILLLFLGTPCSSYFVKTEDKVKSAVFLSPKFELGPGSVVNEYYYDIDFPRGHIELKSFNAEVVDEDGKSIPLHETYLHHWLVVRYHQSKHATQNSDSVLIRNSGICQGNTLGQYFGFGSETRGTVNDIPDPFGIEIGNPAEIPEGFEEKWLVNIHAIDTRGTVDKLGCTECKCDLYNVTIDEYGRAIRPDYKGGMLCCYDYTRCKLKEGFEGPRRSLYLRYTVKWVDWDDFLVPVKIYIMDVTDTSKLSDDSKGIDSNHDCKNEYHVKRTNLPLQTGGFVIYGGAHQHSGGIGPTLYGQNGRVICSSIPTYGNGNEAGNEEGYIVGMSTCYPKPSSVKIIDGETLTLESIYNNTKDHTGVMGLFYLLIAEALPYHHYITLVLQFLWMYYISLDN